VHAPPPPPRVASICDELQTNLGGACSPIGADGKAFELINVHQGLSYGGLKFGDEHWGAGENSPRNLCLLAVYGGVLPQTIVQPTTQSFGTCCALERSTQGSYWFESCSIGDGESNAHGSRDADGNYRPGETLCRSTPERKQCTNYALLEPGDAWATQIGTGASCYSRDDGDGTPFRLECHFYEKPVIYPPPPPAPSPPPPSPGDTATDEKGGDVVTGGMSGGGIFAIVVVSGFFFAIGGYWLGRPEKAKAFASMVRNLASAALGQAKSLKTRTGSTTSGRGAAMANSDYCGSATPYVAPSSNL